MEFLWCKLGTNFVAVLLGMWNFNVLSTLYITGGSSFGCVVLCGSKYLNNSCGEKAVPFCKDQWKRSAGKQIVKFSCKKHAEPVAEQKCRGPLVTHICSGGVLFRWHTRLNFFKIKSARWCCPLSSLLSVLPHGNETHKNKQVQMIEITDGSVHKIWVKPTGC